MGDNEDRARYIHSLTIKEKFNGLGLGAAVLNEIEKEAINCDYLRLDCDSKNPNFVLIIVTLGFRKVGEKITSFCL